MAAQHYVTKHRTKNGTPCWTPSGPLTSRDITEAWIADRELNADKATFVILRKRSGPVLTKLREQRIVVGSDNNQGYKDWLICWYLYM